MPVRSQARWRFMQMIAHGGRPRKGAGGLSREEAAEFVEGQSPEGLPEFVRKLAKKRKR